MGLIRVYDLMTATSKHCDIIVFVADCLTQVDLTVDWCDNTFETGRLQPRYSSIDSDATENDNCFCRDDV